MTFTAAITTAALDGLSFAHQISGEPEGMPVLLLHGWGGAIESMQGVATALASKGYRVHSLDLPGFGRSQIPPDTWGVADYARFVAHYLDAYTNSRVSSPTPNPVNVIGHSFGGRISIVLGADHSAYVRKIVLADSAGVVTPQGMRSVLIALGKAVLKLPGLNAFGARLRQWGREKFGSEDLKNAGLLEPIFRRVIAEDLLPRAARIKAPTLLIWGDQDQDTPLWQGQALEKAIPDAGLVVFQGAGHFAYQERLPDFVRIVDTFFKG